MHVNLLIFLQKNNEKIKSVKKIYSLNF